MFRDGAGPKAVNDIVKQRAELAGLDPESFPPTASLRLSNRSSQSGHSPPEAMEQSRHRSVQQASEYYNTPPGGAEGRARLL